MRCAMMALMRLMGTSSPGSPDVTGAAGAAGAAGFAAAGAGAGAGVAGTGAAAPCFSIKPSTSSLVMRPPAPVPGTWLRSRLLSFAILRTSGEERGASFTPAVAAATGAGAAAGASTFAGGAAGADTGAAAPASPPITPTTVLICTVCPAGTLISVSTPAAGDGISASTLSVEISKRGSSRCTVSPTCLSHFVMVPSKMDSPIWGMMTSVFACPLPEGAGAGAGELAGASGFASAAGEAAGAGAGADAVAFPASSITATTVLIWTVVPSATLISFSTPAAGDG